MSRIVVQFSTPQGQEHDLVMRLRNFGEDLHRWLRSNGWGIVDLNEVDSAEERFAVMGVTQSKMKRVTEWIESEANRQNLLVHIDVASPKSEGQ